MRHARVARLHRRIGKANSVALAAPGLSRRGRTEPQWSDRRLREWNAAEDADASLPLTAQGPKRRVHKSGWCGALGE